MAGRPGDLFVIVRTGTHPVFTRVGDDIQLTVPVTVAEASLGAKVDVPTIDGRAQLKIPPERRAGRSCVCGSGAWRTRSGRGSAATRL